jgi:hypothetical protein
MLERLEEAALATLRFAWRPVVVLRPANGPYEVQPRSKGAFDLTDSGVQGCKSVGTLQGSPDMTAKAICGGISG